MQLLVEHAAQIDLQDNRGMTALMMASAGAHVETIKYLLEQGANKKVVDNNNNTALDHARKAAKESVISLLK